MNRLKEFRQSKGLSIADMASRLDVSQSHYYKVEEGFKNPSFKLLQRFKQEFKHASIDHIFFE